MLRSIGLPELLVLLFLWLLPTFLSAKVASQRGGSGALWGVLAFITGPLAWLVLILAVALNHHRPCKVCRKRIDWQALKCPYCQSNVVEVGWN
jgi:hypothetical protein